MTEDKSTTREGQQPAHSDAPWEGLGVGLFALAAGVLLIAERLGWIPSNVPWGWPLVLLVFGVVTVARALKKR